MHKDAVTAHDVERSEITVSEARARLADVVDAARVGHDPIYLTRRGQRVAAVIDAEDLVRLIAAGEDLSDIEAAAAARVEIDEGDPAIPWEQVKADLGLTRPIEFSRTRRGADPVPALAAPRRACCS